MLSGWHQKSGCGAMDELEARELHHFETERENERLRALLTAHGIDPDNG